MVANPWKPVPNRFGSPLASTNALTPSISQGIIPNIITKKLRPNSVSITLCFAVKSKTAFDSDLKASLDSTISCFVSTVFVGSFFTLLA